VLASIFHTVWTDVFWGYGYWGRGSIPRAILFDVAILVGLVLLVRRRVGGLRKRGNSQESGVSADDGRSQVGDIASSLNPLHHEPLPPFPGTPEDEPK
jgi:hypothetical protein